MSTLNILNIDTTDSSDLTTVEEEQVLDSNLYYMDNHIDNIKNYNIKSFNYIVFEEDLDNMSKHELLSFFNDYFIELINTSELKISIDEVIGQPYRVKLLFIKNVIRFLMNTLPYNYLKQYFEEHEVSGLHDALDLLDVDLVTELTNKIDSSNKYLENFEALMGNVETGITNEKKRNKFNEMLNLLESSMTTKTNLLQYYKSILLDTGNDSLHTLCKAYVKNDLQNLL